MRMRLITLAVAGLSGCQQASEPRFDPEQSATLDRPFVLGVGESIHPTGTSLTITFERLLGDSRCPEGVQCVWAGNGAIAIGLRIGAEPSTTITLNTTIDPQSAAVRGYRLALEDLTPYPMAGTSPVPGRYRAHLRLVRSSLP